MELLKKDIRPSQVITRASIANAIASVAATGGSTNAVLHLLAIARDAGVPLTLDEFDTISTKTPHPDDLKPGGRFTAPDMFAAGRDAAGRKTFEGSRAASGRADRFRPKPFR